MFRADYHLNRGLRALAILAALLLAPACCWAETLVVRNDTKEVIIVQGTCVVRGVVVRDKPAQLKPGETAKIDLPGDKLLIIYDAQRLTPVGQSTIGAARNDQYHSVVVDPKSGKVGVVPTPAR